MSIFCLFIFAYLFIAAGLFSSCSEQALLVVHWPLIAMTSLVAEHRL